MLKNLSIRYLAISTTHLMIILIVVASIFIVFISVAIVKMYILKAENKKLMETNAFKDVDDSYKDFTNSHLYGDN